MIDLVKMDLYKMTKSGLIKMLFCISVVSAGLMLLFAHLIATGNQNIQDTGITSLFLDSQIFTLLGCIIIGMFLCNDFEYKIIENAISGGHSRSTVVISKIISLIILVSIITLPFILSILIAENINLEVSVYMPTAYLSIIGHATTGTSAIYITIQIIVAIIMYSSQLSIGIFLMFLIKKPVIVVALSYVVLLLLGPVLSLNKTTKNIMEYTPFGIDFTQFGSSLKISNVVEPIFISLIFIIIVTGLSVLFFKNSEIK